jgi:hypothetical protein
LAEEYSESSEEVEKQFRQLPLDLLLENADVAVQATQISQEDIRIMPVIGLIGEKAKTQGVKGYARAALAGFLLARQLYEARTLEAQLALSAEGTAEPTVPGDGDGGQPPAAAPGLDQ